MSTDQREDITYALSHARKASIKINEAITFREDSESHGSTGVMWLQSVNSWRKGLSQDEDREVVSDLDKRMWNWKGLRPSDFGDLIIHNFVVVTIGASTSPVRKTSELGTRFH